MKTTLTRSSSPIDRIAATVHRPLLALLGGFVLAMALPSTHAAGPPEAMAYQGFLVDANGNPLAASSPANYPVIFRIFPSPTGGSSLWSEQQIVTVDKGNFSVILSEGTLVSGEPRPALSTVLSTNGVDRYVELAVTIGTAAPAPMLPRLRLLPSPYAFLASSANALVSPNGVPVIKYANNRVEVTGDVTYSGGISGNGAGLSGLSAAQIVSGTFPDARLSGNVALRNGGNAFTGNQTISGNLGIGTPGTGFPLTIGNNTLGDKISLYGQSGNTYGFGIQGGTLQIHTSDAGSDIAFGYGSSAAMPETMRIKGNGNVGIGVQTPNARLSVVAPGAPELQGAAMSTTLRTSAGILGTSAGAEMALASIGFYSGNHSSLGVRARRTSVGADWPSTAIGLSMDVDNSPLAGASLWLHANGNVGIGTVTPTAKLEINGGIKVAGANTIELGGGILGKEPSAGRIGYQAFTAGALDIVGAGTTGSNRRVKIWSEGGASITGNVGFNIDNPLDHLHMVGGAVRIDDGAGRYVRMYRQGGDFIIWGNQMPQAGNGPSQIRWDGDGNWDQSSDRILKKDITDAEPVLSRLMQMPVRRYRWKAEPADSDMKFGVIAQEVEPLFPDVVGTMLRAGDTNETMTVKSGAFGLIAAKAVQELKAEKDAENAALKREVGELRQEVALLKSQLTQTAQIESLQQELDGLKQIVQQMAAARQEPKTAAVKADVIPASLVASTTETVASR